MYAVSRVSSSVPAAAIVTLGLFFLMQMLIESTPVSFPKTDIKKQVPIIEFNPPETPPPPSVTERPPLIESPGIPTMTYTPPKNKTPRVISELPFIPTETQITHFNLENSDAYVLVQAPTIYPLMAQSRGVEGFALIEYSVGPGGMAVDAILIEESPAGYGFGKAALRAIIKFKFQPRVVDGQALATPGMRERFIFELED